jgi:hypothetical protein
VQTPENSRNGSQKLNVIFHGAFAFDQVSRPGRILALIPYIDHHVYRAGNWLAETDIRGNINPGDNTSDVEYELRGVEAGSEQFRPDQTLMVTARHPGRPSARPYATLDFPLPETITATYVADIPLSAIDGADDLLVDKDPQRISTLEVFTYTIENEDAVMLKATDGKAGHYWQPAVVDDHINLHIFAAEDHYHPVSNADEDFNKCTELLGGVRVRLDTTRLPASRVLTGPPLPPGVDDREAESLANRTERLARLGRLVLQPGGDANVAWFGNDALDGNPEGCTGPAFDEP